MKNYFKSNFLFLKQALFDDLVDRVLFIISFLLFTAAYLIWHHYLSSPDLFVYLRIDIYPIKLLAAIMIINTLLVLAAYKREKEIGYFLFISNILSGLLILVLEIYYLSN